MKTNYLEQSIEAAKTAIEYDVKESEARKNDEHELAQHCLDQATYYRGQSRKLYREFQK
tara:strand:+ start:1074 stop:1250 length:177 start_codon:yes stop_codon:yes gene_type:complete